MIIPAFSVSSTDEDVIINIETPCLNPEESEIYVDGREFVFYSGPYFLRLELPGALLETDDCSGFYDNEKLTFTVRVKKKTKGEPFERLDSLKPILEEYECDDNTDTAIEKTKRREVEVNQCEFGFKKNFLKTSPPTSNSSNDIVLHIQPPSYGFGNMYCNIFRSSYEEFKEVIELPNPDETKNTERKELKEKIEVEKWSDDHYLADTMTTDHIVPLINFKPEWNNLNKHAELTEKEKAVFDGLKQTDFVLTPEMRDQVNRQMIDILFAYCYNHRTTEGENTSESGWTINKISSTLSFFEEFDNLKNVLVSCYRRGLCYPLYRNFDLLKKVHEDVVLLLKLDTKWLLKCFLDIHSIFSNSDLRFLLNRLYINDYCCYVSTLSKEYLSLLSDELDKVCVKKEDLDFEIPELEIAACLVLQENQENFKTGDVIKKLTTLTIASSDDSSSDSSSTDSESSSEEETSESIN